MITLIGGNSVSVMFYHEVDDQDFKPSFLGTFCIVSKSVSKTGNEEYKNICTRIMPLNSNQSNYSTWS